MINKTNIIIYIIAVIASIPAGIFTAWGSLKYYEEKSIFEKGLLKSVKKETGRYIIALLLNLITFLGLTYYKANFLGEEGQILIPKLIEYLQLILITPLLLIAFFVDIEYKVIPNRVSMLIFQLGILTTMILGFTNINKFTDALYGMLVAFVTFIVISLVGGLVAGKEAMGFGDLKFITPIGLFLGLYGTINLIISAFVFSAVISIFVVIARLIRKEPDKYIPFGPFIVLAFYFTLFAPQDIAIISFMKLSEFLGNYLTKEGGGTN